MFLLPLKYLKHLRLKTNEKLQKTRAYLITLYPGKIRKLHFSSRLKKLAADSGWSEHLRRKINSSSTLISSVIFLIFILLPGAINQLLATPDVNHFPSNNFYRTITDLAGRQVKVPAKIERVVALNGSLRYVVYLQATDLVVAVENIEKINNLASRIAGNQLISGRPYQAAIASRIDPLHVIGEGGPGRLPDFEALSIIRPDLVLVYEVETANFVQLRTGIPAVVIFKPGVEGVDFNEIKRAFSFSENFSIVSREHRRS